MPKAVHLTTALVVLPPLKIEQLAVLAPTIDHEGVPFVTEPLTLKSCEVNPGFSQAEAVGVAEAVGLGLTTTVTSSLSQLSNTSPLLLVPTTCNVSLWVPTLRLLTDRVQLKLVPPAKAKLDSIVDVIQLPSGFLPMMKKSLDVSLSDPISSRNVTFIDWLPVGISAVYV